MDGQSYSEFGIRYATLNEITTPRPITNSIMELEI